jgi:hypothetical protein
MPNPRRGEVEIELAGTPYTLVFDWNAISEIEAAFNDRPIDQLFFAGSIGRRAIREAIRAGLARKYRPHTAKQVGKLISETVEADPDAFEKIVKAVIKGLLAANGIAQDKIDELDQALDEQKIEEEERAESRPSTAPAIGTT